MSQEPKEIDCIVVCCPKTPCGDRGSDAASSSEFEPDSTDIEAESDAPDQETPQRKRAHPPVAELPVKKPRHTSDSRSREDAPVPPPPADHALLRISPLSREDAPVSPPFVDNVPPSIFPLLRQGASVLPPPVDNVRVPPPSPLFTGAPAPPIVNHSAPLSPPDVDDQDFDNIEGHGYDEDADVLDPATIEL